MKRFMLFFLVTLINVYPQQINLPLVTGASGASFTQASNEFNTFATTYDALNWDATAISAQFGYNISWSQPMLMWNGYRPEWPKWTAFSVIAYAQAFRSETNITRKSIMKPKQKGELNFYFG
jgi:hypothetical protein